MSRAGVIECDGFSLNIHPPFTLAFLHYFPSMMVDAAPMPVHLKEDFKALLDAAGVPISFQLFLDKNRCHTVKSFARAASSEEQVDSQIIDACGIDDLNFGDKVPSGQRMLTPVRRSLLDPLQAR